MSCFFNLNHRQTFSRPLQINLFLHKEKKVQFKGKTVHCWPLLFAGTLLHQILNTKRHESKHRN